MVIDTSAVNKIAKTPGAYEAVCAAIDRGDLEILYTHVVRDELAATEDSDLRRHLIAVLCGLGHMIPTNAFVLDYSRLDMAELAGPDDAARMHALRSGNIEHARDALIALTALRPGRELLTHEKRHQPRTAREQGIEVMHIDQLLTEIGFTCPEQPNLQN